MGKSKPGNYAPPQKSFNINGAKSIEKKNRIETHNRYKFVFISQ